MSTIRTILASVGAILLLALPLGAQADETTVNGSIVLPEGASLEGAAAWTLEIQDTSQADAPAGVIGRTGGVVADAAASEIPFAAGFDAAAIDDGSSYTLSASVLDEAANILFLNDTAIPVITGGAPTDGVEVPLVAVDSESTGEPRVIELEADLALRFLQDGEQIMDIPVTPGETVIFRIDNTAGFPHNFYIGADEALQVPSGTTDVGLPDWDSGVQELEWVVPEDIAGLRFACTVPGHYALMQGGFSIAP